MSGSSGHASDADLEKEASKSMVKESLHLIRSNPRMLLFVLVSVVGTYVSVLVVMDSLGRFESILYSSSFVSPSQITPLAAYLGIAAMFFSATFVITICNVALIRFTVDVVDPDGEPSILASFATAVAKLPHVLVHSSIVASFGFLLAATEGKKSPVAKLTVYLFGGTYAIMKFFSFPSAVIENKGPISMYRRSIHVVRATFGDVAKVTLGVYTLVFVIAKLSLTVVILLGWVPILFGALGVETLSRATLFLYPAPTELTLQGMIVPLTIVSLPVVAIPALLNFKAVLKTVLYVEATTQTDVEAMSETAEYAEKLNDPAQRRNAG